MNDGGRYRKTYIRLWRHPGFGALTEGEKVLALYVLTGPQTNRLGLYVFSIATAAEDLGTLPKTITKRLANVCLTFGWLFDKRSRVIFIQSWFRWNVPENQNVLKGSLKDLNEIPPCGLVDAFARNIETLPPTLHETFLEGLRQRLPKRLPNQDQYQDAKQKQEQKQAALRAGAEKEKPTNGNGHLIDDRLVSIASDALKKEPKGQDTDYYLEIVRIACRPHAHSLKNAEAVAILTQAWVELGWPARPAELA